VDSANSLGARSSQAAEWGFPKFCVLVVLNIRKERNTCEDKFYVK